MLSCRDSNPERQNQNLLCYHYTTAQSVARKRWQRYNQKFKMQNSKCKIFQNFSQKNESEHKNCRAKGISRLAKCEKPQHTWAYVRISSASVTQKSPHYAVLILQPPHFVVCHNLFKNPIVGFGLVFEFEIIAEHLGEHLPKARNKATTKVLNYLISCIFRFSVDKF